MFSRPPPPPARTRSALLLPVLFILVACSDAPPGQEVASGITEGVWVMEADPDRFLWEFTHSESGLSCSVHVLQGGVKLNEMPCRTSELDGLEVTVSMDTGVTLEGEVDLNRGRIRGHLVGPDGSRNPVELNSGSPDDYPFLTARVGAEGPYTYRIPTDIGDGWPVGDATSVGIQPAALEELVAAVDRGEFGVLHSLLVARHGRLVLEEYFHGYDQQDLHHLASVTKSVSSLLIGLAIQEGSMPGVDTKLLSFFPGAENTAAEGWEALTLEDLLTMSLALDWSPQEADNLHGTGPEFFHKVLSRSVVGMPGRDFQYVSANVNLIAGILHQTTGSHAEAFAERALFGPLGIRRWDWTGRKTEGYNLMDGSLRLVPRDMAKLGQMALGGGQWNGAQVVAQDWIHQATSTQIQATLGLEEVGSEGYGYLWWTLEIPGPEGTPLPVFFANGWGSQFIIGFPTLDLLVVTTGGNEYNGKHMSVGEGILLYLLPAIQVN